ncbi:MAG: hypothetical protein ACLVKR_02145 [Lachnospiraceae bacterium]
MVLFINSCPRKRGVSRTLELCDCFIEQYLQKNPSDEVKEIALYEKEIKCLNYEEICRREKCFAQGTWKIKCFIWLRSCRGRKDHHRRSLLGLIVSSALKVYTERICVMELPFSTQVPAQKAFQKRENDVYYDGGRHTGKMPMEAPICARYVSLSAREFVDFLLRG